MSKQEFDSFEELFRKGLGGYREDPADHVWQKIDASITEDRKRKVPFWLWLLPALLIATGSLFYISQQAEHPLPPQTGVFAGQVPATASSEAPAGTTGTAATTATPSAIASTQVRMQEPFTVIATPVVSTRNNTFTTTTPAAASQQPVPAPDMVSASAYPEQTTISLQGNDPHLYTPAITPTEKLHWQPLSYHAPVSFYLAATYRISRQQFFGAIPVDISSSNDLPGTKATQQEISLLGGISRKGWFVQSGLKGTRISRENTVDVFKKEVRKSTYYSYDQFLNAMPNSFHDTVYTLQTEKIQENIQLISIPIELGYRFRMGRHTIGAAAGIQYSFVSSATLRIPATPLINSGRSTYSLVDEKDLHINRHLLGLNAAVQYELLVNRHLALQIGSGWNTQLRSIWKENTVAGKWKGFGMQTGVKYTF